MNISTQAMKHFLFILLVFMLGKVSAQVYIPFPGSAAAWVNKRYQAPSTLMSAESYCVNGQDTLINSFTYTQVRYYWGGYKGAWRDAGGKVMFVPVNSQQEYLLYDFTLNAGDTAHNVYMEGIAYPFGLYDAVVTSVDSVQVNGAYRKQLHIEAQKWIEGIGNTGGLFRDCSPNVSMSWYELDCMSYRDTSLYPGTMPGSCALTTISDLGLQNRLVIYPNPGNGKFMISGWPAGADKAIMLVNSLGQSINVPVVITDRYYEIDLRQYPAGIYTVVIRTPREVLTQKAVKE